MISKHHLTVQQDASLIPEVTEEELRGICGSIRNKEALELDRVPNKAFKCVANANPCGSQVHLTCAG